VSAMVGKIFSISFWLRRKVRHAKWSGEGELWSRLDCIFVHQL
jgi:hypothetical protein